ncbi:unnamed protein product, partial [Scytosiphon promiscuus]
SPPPPSPSLERDGAVDLEDERRRNSWRWQAVRALSGVGLAEILWLQRIEVSASAGNLQLWLPGAERGVGTAAAAAAAVGGRGQGGAEAVVASCRHCHAGVSIAVGLLSSEDAPPAGSAQHSPRADNAPAPATHRRSGSSEPEQPAVGGREENTDDAAAAAAPAADEAAAAAAAEDSHVELCVTSLGLYDLELFVTRPSASDFGPPEEKPSPPPLPPPPRLASPDIGAGNAGTITAPATGGDRRPRGGSSNTEGIILPFSADVKHVLSARSSSSAAAPPPLLSEVDATVTAIQAVVFLNFPLAASIIENSFEPLLLGGGGGGGGGAASPAPESSGAQEAEGTGPAGTPSTVHGVPPPSRVGGVGPAEDRPAIAVAEAAGGCDGGAASAAATALSELAKMWTCRGGFQAAGLKAELVNNFYRQKRPSVIVNIPAVTGELTSSGASRSVLAIVSAEMECDFYNARLMAWEPLMEPWRARAELEVVLGGGLRRRRSGLGQPLPSSSSAGGTSEAAKRRRKGRFSGGWARRSGGAGGGGGGERQERQGLAQRLSNHRVSWRQGGSAATAPAGESAAAGAGGRGRPVAAGGTVVDLRLVSDDVLNLNLTESLVENLAAISHAQQRQEETERLEEGGWAGRGDNSFSLHWLRNETGLPVVCSAHYREPLGGGSDGGHADEEVVPVRVPVGEEAPVVASLGLPVRAVVLEFEEAGEEQRKRGGGGGGGGDGDAAETTTTTMVTAAETATRWRSRRPVDLDVVGGQRLTTMVAVAETPSATSTDGEPRSPYDAGTAQSPTAKSGALWRSGSWTWSSRAAAAAAAAAAEDEPPGMAETLKVVTEVESHHGVQVLRVRSLVEVANVMGGDVCMHVGLVGEEDAPGGSRGRSRRLSAPPAPSASRFEWETVVLPGRSCPVPATLAAAVLEGRKLLVVRPIMRHGDIPSGPPSGGSGLPPPSLDPGGDGEQEALQHQQHPQQGAKLAEAASANGAAEEFEEAFLALPDPSELLGHGDATGGAADSNATYHRTIEFAPTPAALFADPPRTGERRTKTVPVFCGVSVARKKSAERGGGGSGSG